MEKILVQIACRLDKELKKTINDLYNKADNPDEVEVLIINQDFEHDCWKQSDFSEKVTLINIDESKTRNLAQTRAFCKLYVKPSHQYFMNIDAHSRFDKSWDTILINAHKDYIDNFHNKCMISVYPKGYKILENGEDNLIKDDSIGFNRIVSDQNDTFRFEAVPALIQNPESLIEKYNPSAVAGGFHFTSIDWVIDVGYDTYCGWIEHELNITLRTFCHGYDIVSYYKRPIYHLYDHSQRKSLTLPHFNYGINSYKRLRSQIKQSNLTFLENNYSLGNVRTIEDFENYFKFDLRKILNIS
jgi:hypothetical protein